MRDDGLAWQDTAFDALVFEHASVPLVIVGKGAARLNRAARELDGLDLAEVLGGAPRPSVATFFDEIARDGRAQSDLCAVDADGQVRHLTVTGQLLGEQKLVTVRDRTEARGTEEELRLLRRMESFGYMTASVVHDFNNLLTPMVCLTSLLDRELPQGSRPAALVRDLRAISERAAGLARQMLTFARPGRGVVERIELNEMLDQMRMLVERVSREDVEVVLAKHASPCDVMVDREQLEHVVLNLVANARDAMPRGGRLAIRIEKVRGDHPAIAHLGGNARDEVVALTVTDSGTGMTREVREKIFERFFTTKEPGRGTGLGLATAHRFVTGCGGAIEVRSEPGKGTTVAIYLPAAAPDTSARPVQTARSTPRGTETVLVVEDDKHVREVIRLVLEQAGYRVLATGSGEDALRASTAHEGAIHLVIADVVMPEMNGRAVVEALRSARPGLRALYVSGHTDDALARAGSGISPLLRKAFSPSDLEVEVRRILDAAA